jgi:hypothetical protein
MTICLLEVESAEFILPHIERLTAAESAQRDLAPGQLVSEELTSFTDPDHVRVVTLTCTTDVAAKHLKLRKRYPLLKLLWPIRYRIDEVP